MESIEQKLVELIEKFENLAVELGPEVVEIGLNAARVMAAQGLVYGFLALAVAVVFLWFPIKVWGGVYEEGDAAEDVAFATFITSVSSIPSLIATIIALTNLLDIWNWVGVFEPKLWIAKQVLGW